jgi:hypothetical protein
LASLKVNRTDQDDETKSLGRFHPFFNSTTAFNQQLQTGGFLSTWGKIHNSSFTFLVKLILLFSLGSLFIRYTYKLFFSKLFIVDIKSGLSNIFRDLMRLKENISRDVKGV